jgi:hypothetical protein
MLVEWKYDGSGEEECFSDKVYVSGYHLKIKARLQVNFSSVIR